MSAASPQRLLALSLLCLMATLSSLTVHAQTITATISCTVADESGANVSDPANFGRITTQGNQPRLI